jgi:hypothetical protein
MKYPRLQIYWITKRLRAFNRRSNWYKLTAAALAVSLIVLCLQLTSCYDPQGNAIPATVHLDGISSATLDAIKGDKGDTGAAGADGAAGAKGDKGDTGDTGAAGSKGDKGDTGAAGAKGDKGDTGDTGAAGAKGDKGDTGAAGAKGDKGDTGDTGAAGAKGDKGDTGAAGAKGDKGDTGDTGAAGAKGDKGDTGAAGAKGDKGDTGAAGADGLNYSDQFIDLIHWQSLSGWNTSGTTSIEGSLLHLSSYSAICENNQLQLNVATGKTISVEWIISYLAATSGVQYLYYQTGTTAGTPSNTNNHFGFEISGSAIISTNANGSMETSNNVGTISAGSQFTVLRAVFNPGTDCKYYVNGILQSTQLTNLPANGSYGNLINTAAADIYIGRIMIMRQY